jgi:hypothetical protein
LTDWTSPFELEFNRWGEKMAAYDPETLFLLRKALDEAWSLLSEERRATTLKSEMAHRILKRAAAGERDPIRLRAAAIIEATS